MAQTDPQQFEVYRKQPNQQVKSDDSNFWLLLVLIGMIAVGMGGLMFASGGDDDTPANEADENPESSAPGAAAPQAVFDRLDWIEEQEGADSALLLAEEKYLVEFPNAPNLLKRIDELKAATTVGESVELMEMREDARKQVFGGQPQEALETIEQILELSEQQDAEGFYLKAHALRQTGDDFGALSALEEAELLGYNAQKVAQLRTALENE